MKTVAKQNGGRINAGIIGAGFSGLVAAISLARLCPSSRIVIFEGKSQAGKKILVTGNGRCNLTNETVSSEFYHGDVSLFERVYPQADNASLLSFFSSLGVLTARDFAGRYYPVSNQAVSVLDALVSEACALGIEIITDCRITDVKKTQHGFVLNGEYDCERLVFACGGKAAPVHGSDGSGFEILSSLGIRSTPLSPSLVPLYCAGFEKSLKGIRARGTVSIKNGGRVLASDTGEIQYTDYGLSGIPAFQVSPVVSELLREGQKVTAFVDSAPFMERQELEEYITASIKRYPSSPAGNVLEGIMTKKLSSYLISQCSLNPQKPASTVSAGAAGKIAAAVKSKKYEITRTGGFADAQVTSGGVASGELCENSLGLRKLRGAYVCGEMLDVDGLCGGYNLQWAYSSAVSVADSIAKELQGASH